MFYIDTLRASVARMITYALWLHVPIIMIASWVNNQEGTLWVGLLAAFIAGVPTVMWKAKGYSFEQAMIAAVSAILLTAVLVFVFRGHDWQIDIHMYFFAVIAMLSTLCSSRILIAAAGVTTLHHLFFNLAVPSWIFPGEDTNLLRVGFHVAVVVLEIGVLSWLSKSLAAAFMKAEEAEKKAEGLAGAAEEAAAKARAEAEASLLDAQKANEEVAQLAKESEEKQRFFHETAAKERERLADEFDRSLSGMLTEISDVVKELEAEAGMLQSISDDTSSAMQVAEQATDNVASNVNSVAVSAEQMSAAVAEISRQVTTSSSVADQARGHAEDSRNRIAELADRADKINNVLSMIGDIAEQTNLLALNATIEAARAGDAGKGFAVVASEVKSLANQSANATDEIGKLLSGILEATGDAVQVNKEIVSVVSQISDSSAGIASAVEEQTATTDEIARAAQLAATDTVEAGRSVADLNEIGNKITEASRLTAKVVSTLSEKTLALSQRSNDFIAGIRAG